MPHASPCPPQVFIQRAAVNLLSTVLDTPEFFWSAPDTMQTLYKRICEYMELDDRVEVLNNRFSVRSLPSADRACHGTVLSSLHVRSGRRAASPHVLALGRMHAAA